MNRAERMATYGISCAAGCAALCDVIFGGFAKETLTSEAPAFKRAMSLFVEYFGALWD